MADPEVKNELEHNYIPMIENVVKQSSIETNEVKKINVIMENGSVTRICVTVGGVKICVP